MNEPVHLSYEAFQDLSAGIYRVMTAELAGAVREGKIYIVKHEGVAFQVAVDKEGNLLLKDE